MTLPRTLPGTLIDISRTLEPSLAVWPGDTPFARRTVLSMAEGAFVNLSTLTLSSHTGAHVDAPFHVQRSGVTIEHLALDAYWGPAQVVTVHKPTGSLAPEDLGHVNLSLAPRLLVRSTGSTAPHDVFPAEFVYPSPLLAEVLGRAGIVLYGSDTPSMDHADSKDLSGHNALLAAGIAILEGLDLRAAPDGVYELVALPLKIAGGDGSPVRAALRTL
jgi:arylformamidase